MTATGVPAAVPITICPACPMAVERGKLGMRVYGIRIAPESSSAKPPSPEPSTRPILGRSVVCERRKWAADSVFVKSSFMERFTYLLVTRISSRLAEDSSQLRLKLLLKFGDIVLQLPLYTCSLIAIEILGAARGHARRVRTVGSTGTARVLVRPQAGAG